MVLYRPGGFTQITLDELYRMRGWTESWGCSGTQYRYGTPSGWKCDPSYPEVIGVNGTHGGCSSCLMTELQVVANYQTEATFVSNPPGAQIFIDGIEWFPGAVTASDGATFRGISPGTHTYELRIAGYQSATGTFELALNTPVIVTGTLVPPCVPIWQCEQPLNGNESDGCGNKRANPACAPPQTGSISFTSIPSGAEIFLDGTDQGVKTPNTVSNVPVGTHTYIFKLAGYNDYTGVVLVELNMMAQVSATLTIMEGCIYFNTTQAGVRIFIDNVDTGKVTPALICGLSLGPHTYRLSLTGYQDITGNVNLAAGQGTTVTGILTKKGMGTGTMLALGLLGAGVLGAIIIGSGNKTTIMTREVTRRQSGG